jgi:hypothetical protein
MESEGIGLMDLAAVGREYPQFGKSVWNTMRSRSGVFDPGGGCGGSCGCSGSSGERSGGCGGKCGDGSDGGVTLPGGVGEIWVDGATGGEPNGGGGRGGLVGFTGTGSYPDVSDEENDEDLKDVGSNFMKKTARETDIDCVGGVGTGKVTCRFTFDFKGVKAVSAVLIQIITNIQNVGFTCVGEVPSCKSHVRRHVEWIKLRLPLAKPLTDKFEASAKGKGCNIVMVGHMFLVSMAAFARLRLRDQTGGRHRLPPGLFPPDPGYQWGGGVNIGGYEGGAVLTQDAYGSLLNSLMSDHLAYTNNLCQDDWNCCDGSLAYVADPTLTGAYVD